MTNREKARDYAARRRRNLHLSQRDSNLIQLAYLHGLEDNEQLTKAKEFLKWALHSDPEHDEDFEKKWSEAEQFLKETDK